MIGVARRFAQSSRKLGTLLASADQQPRGSAFFTANQWRLYRISPTWTYRCGSILLWLGARLITTVGANADSRAAEGKIMQLLLKVDQNGEIGLQTQVYEQMRAMILEGQLRAGEPLPATRSLSEQLGVSRNTMTLAYERLIAEGYIETRQSVGTFVSMQIPEKALYTLHKDLTGKVQKKQSSTKATTLDFAYLRSQILVNPNRLSFDFWVGRPDPNSFPIKTWAKLINQRLLRGGSAITEYRDPIGLAELRSAIAEQIRPARGIVAQSEQILIVGGCQDGLNLICRMLMRVGSSAVVESPSYQGAVYLFESFGAELHPVPIDEKGLDVTKLPEIKGSVAYVTPSHQYPMGVTLTLDRRLELLAWALRNDAYIIEDDYDSDFRFQGSPIAALKGLDRGERVIYMGTFSKCLGAGLRLGYVVLPPALVGAARHFKTLMNNGQPWLEQAALADFMTSGGYERHLRRIRKHYLSRRNALLTALQEHFGASDVVGSEAGMHLVWRLPDHLPPASEIEARGLEIGVGVYTLASGAAIHFGDDQEYERFLVFGFSSLSEKEIDAGIRLLAQALNAQAKTHPSKTPSARRRKAL